MGGQGEDRPRRWPYALIQVSCAIRLHSRESQSRDKPDELGPPSAVFADILQDLRHFRVAEKPLGFELSPLYETYDPGPERRVPTLLRTRHRAVEVPDCFRHKDGTGFPAALDWDERDAGDALWAQYLRVQVARDSDEKTDVNDWLLWPADSETDGGPSRSPLEYRGVMAPPPPRPAPPPRTPRDDLEGLRDYFAYLFAQRRQAVFASNVSDRSYNVWLPPALLAPVAGHRDHPCHNAMLAMLPFVTLLRLPHQSSWRPTVIVTTLFVPVSADITDEHGTFRATLKPRALCDEGEARAITMSLEGSTSQALKDAQNRYTCRGGLGGYLTAIARGRCPDGRDLPRTLKRCRCFPPEIPATDEGDVAGWTIRQYLEAVLLVAAARAPQTKWEPRRQGRKAEPWLQSWRRHNRPGNRQRMAASEVARSVRLSSVWSIQLLSRDQIAWVERGGRYLPARTLRQRLARTRPGGPDGGDSQFAGLPKDVRGVARKLAGIGHLPTWRDRVDNVTTIDSKGGMTWSMPRARCLLSVQSVRDDHFPGTSPLNSFVRVGVMVMAAAAIREMTQALLHETVQASGSAALAHVDKNLLVELEEVYGSDIVGPAFSRFYRSLREHLDLDEEYRQVRERVQSLAAAISQETNIKASKRAGGVAFAAAAFGAAILLMTLYSYPRPNKPGIAYEWTAFGVPGMAFVFALAAIFVAFGPVRVRGKLWTVIGVVTATLVILFFLLEAFHFGVYRR